MKLFEYEAKKILVKNGIPIPEGKLVTSLKQVQTSISTLIPPYVVKAQVLASGRAKAGGIIFADSVLDVETAAKKLLNKQIKNLPVTSLLIEEKILIKRELYLGITVDRFNQSYVIIASSSGGTGIEEISYKRPDKIFKHLINPQLGVLPSHARDIATKLGYKGNQINILGKILESLYHILVDNDAELIELNPLAETQNNQFVALDTHIIIDDNALFRHPKLKKRHSYKGLSHQEISALKHGLAYVKLDGNIGVIGNGAGLVMTTLDLIHHYSGKPANFLDIGGGAVSEKIETAFQIVYSDPNVEVLLINIFGGITRCDEVAKGIVEIKRKIDIKKPIIIRLVGTNEKEGRQILNKMGIPVLTNMEEATKKIVDLSKQVEKV